MSGKIRKAIVAVLGSICLVCVVFIAVKWVVEWMRASRSIHVMDVYTGEEEKLFAVRPPHRLGEWIDPGSTVSWSPDSKKISLIRASGQLFTKEEDLLLISAAGEKDCFCLVSTRSPLSRSLSYAWLPDGLIVSYKAPAEFALYDRNYRKLKTFSPGEKTAIKQEFPDSFFIVSRYSVSPDGKMMLFAGKPHIAAPPRRASYEKEGEKGLSRIERSFYLLPLDDLEERKLGLTFENTAIIWSPDSRKVLLQPSYGLLGVCDLRGLIDDRYCWVHKPEEGEDMPEELYRWSQWSPDSKWINFLTVRKTTVRQPHGITTERNVILNLIDSDGNNCVRLAEHIRFSYSNPNHAWSPDNKSITYVSEDGGIYIVDVTTGASVRLVDGGTCPAWSPDGKKIAFLDDNSMLCLMSPDGSGRVKLTSGTSEFYWSPDSRKIAFLK